MNLKNTKGNEVDKERNVVSSPVKRVIIIHGWRGIPSSGWKPWLKQELEKKGFEASVPEMPNTNNPKMKEWVKNLSDEIGVPDEKVFLVGHSLGCITILRYLESIEKQIGGAVLIGGPIDNRGIEEIDSFFESPIDWNKIKKNCKKFITINSDDDYYIPLNHGEKIRDELDAEMIIKKNHKHFSADDGFTELPVALDSVLKLAGE